MSSVTDIKIESNDANAYNEILLINTVELILLLSTYRFYHNVNRK